MPAVKISEETQVDRRKNFEDKLDSIENKIDNVWANFAVYLALKIKNNKEREKLKWQQTNSRET